MTVYVSPNFKSRKALKEHLKAGLEVAMFLPGLGEIPENGTVYLAGPHYPEPHKWYATGTVQDGKLVEVK